MGSCVEGRKTKIESTELGSIVSLQKQVANDAEEPLGKDLFDDEEECSEEQNDCLLDLEHENTSILCCDRKKEKRIDIVTYLSPEIGVKSKAEFTPLVSPTRKTLPFNVRELFKTAVNKEKQRSKLRSNIKELKLITGGNVIIRDKHMMEDQSREPAQDTQHKLSKDSGVATQSARPFRMSSAHLVLPKLALIGQQQLPSEVTSPSPQTEISKKGLILNGLDNQGRVGEMGQQEGVSGSSLAEMLLKAQEMLNSSRLDDAETQLLRLYQQMQEKPEDNTKILVQALIAKETMKMRFCIWTMQLKIPDIHNEKDLVYGGLEKVTLPDCLQDEVDCQEEVVLSPTALARYLLVLSHKMLGQMHQAGATHYGPLTRRCWVVIYLYCIQC
ncbi:hypothetical protein FSP39_013475 [Pinctada imbricata]|uniref:Uncharacterized protein n=1 Tax=Pinctada imbricata TaxID=66713 RepID=A0AA88YJ52_PINIB|nr:hypothetical protein FSP39_013475 [Pinctada imbricata]